MSMILEAPCVPVVGRSRLAAYWIPPVAPYWVPVNMRNPSRIMAVSLSHLDFVVQDRVTGSDGNPTEGGHRLSIELLDPEQDVRLVHGLEVEVGADHTVAVDHRAAHIGPDLGSVGGLHGRRRGRRGGQTVQATDQEVNQVRGADAGQLSNVDVRYANNVTPV